MTRSDSGLSWPDTALAAYGETMTVKQVAAATATTPRAIRDLIQHSDETRRLPATKLGRGWVVGRADLRDYLLRHRNTKEYR